MTAFDLAKIGATVVNVDACNEASYRIAPNASCEDHRIEGARLVVRVVDSTVEWGLFAWVASDDDGDQYGLVAHGYGFAGSLREARHTYFGPDGGGYIFYVEPWILAWGFSELARWFDFENAPVGGQWATLKYDERSAVVSEVLALFDAKGANLPTRDDVAALLEKP